MAVLKREDRDTYLELLRDGVRSDEAARRIGTTATHLRRLRKRDPAFAAEYEEARQIGRMDYPDELRDKAREMALDGQPQLLSLELATYSQDHRHLRRDRQTVEHTHQGVVIHLDAETLAALPLAEKKQLRDALAKVGGRMIEPPSVDTNGDVVSG
jgi:hypothetical protein